MHTFIHDISLKKAYLIFIAISLLSGISILIFTFIQQEFQYGDNCGYLSLGIAYAQGRGFIDPALPGSFSFLWWPPGFPLIISLFYIIFGAQWTLLKLLILILLYFSFVLFAGYLYKREKNVVKTGLILAALCMSSGIHLLSSYLYSETFFIACTLLFFFVWYQWELSLSLRKIIMLSLLALFCSLVRLAGICIPAALILYLFFFPKKTALPRYYSLIPLVITIIYVYCALFIPQCYIGSFRATAGIHPDFKKVQTQTSPTDQTSFTDQIQHIASKSITVMRVYWISLVPQAVVGSIYDSHAMNRTKMIGMALVSLLVITGWFVTLRRYGFMSLYTLIYTVMLFNYSTWYLRVVVPIIPFLLLYLYSGLEKWLSLLIKREAAVKVILVILWIGVIFDNTLKSVTNPRITMPPLFGDTRYQKCLDWTINNAHSRDVVVCQVHSYLYLKRGEYCLPFNYATTVNQFMNYLDEHDVKYIIVSPFKTRSHDTYMKNTYTAITVYPDLFKRVYGEENDSSCVVQYLPIKR